ncbi:DUF5683 domain-containing protein [Catalinimonas niigatensis]|uniref:DUF5683 domain-containing protein n=1 Tax=Catalinimonas niigatensis TaxID=1397264 RepID=UPI0026665C46|nr:DUF5683 domain-containing protein [Catalinimonas niigatensis]WPP50263.1 DUF5683 domain-containing protein [Catalinimonas niigatensis]
MLKECIICMLGLLMLITNQSLAQEEEESEPDTTVIMQDTIEINDQGLISTDLEGNDATSNSAIIISGRNTKKIPRKAALYAAVLPGLGQIYNGGYWKLPIVYGTFITLGWFITWREDQYQVFRRANIALESGLPEQNPLQGTLVGDNLRVVSNNVETSRRERDFMYIVLTGAYALQIMEAIVDAHLIEFDVNEDLSMEFQPSTGQYFASATGAGTFVPALGASLILKIK